MSEEFDPAQPLRNQKHERFVQALLSGDCADAAYKAAGYRPNRQNAARLTTNDDIRARLAHLQSLVTAAVVEETAVTVSSIVRELARIGFSDIKRFAHVRNHEDLAELPDQYSAAVQELVIEEYLEGRGEDAERCKRIRIKLHGKESPLVNLGKHLGMFEKDKGQVGDVVEVPKAPSPERLEEMRKRYMPKSKPELRTIQGGKSS